MNNLSFNAIELENLMKKINLFAPQWQGSGKTTELFKGAQALKDFCISIDKTIQFINIPISEALDLKIENNIYGYTVIEDQLINIKKILCKENPDLIFSIGGGCGIEIPIVSYFKDIYQSMDIYWFDAHGDLNTPETSPSKYFHGMPLRFLLDEIPKNNISKSFNKISKRDISLIGSRDLDNAEVDFIQKEQIRLFNMESSFNVLEDRFSNYLEKSRNSHAYLHIDLDVLDPRSYSNVKCPTEDGLSIENLLRIIKIIGKKRKIIGLSILENTELDSSKITKIEQLVNLGIDL